MRSPKEKVYIQERRQGALTLRVQIDKEKIGKKTKKQQICRR